MRTFAAETQKLPQESVACDKSVGSRLLLGDYGLQHEITARLLWTICFKIRQINTCWAWIVVITNGVLTGKGVKGGAWVRPPSPTVYVHQFPHSSPQPHRSVCPCGPMWVDDVGEGCFTHDFFSTESKMCFHPADRPPPVSLTPIGIPGISSVPHPLLDKLWGPRLLCFELSMGGGRLEIHKPVG